MDECGDILDEEEKQAPSPVPPTIAVDLHSKLGENSAPPPEQKPLPPTVDVYSLLRESNTPPEIPRRTTDSHGITNPVGGGGGGGGGVEESVYETPTQPRENATSS